MPHFKALFIIFICHFSVLTALQTQPVVLISYYSRTGNTELMAESVAKGARMVEGVTVILKRIDEITQEDILAAGAIIVGSPVYNASVAPSVHEFISSWPFEGSPLRNKLGASFVTAGGISAGEELAMLGILHSMLIFNMIVIGGDDWSSAFGASGIRGEEPFSDSNPMSTHFLNKGEALGRRVAETLLKLR